jgi:hypothetical protein
MGTLKNKGGYGKMAKKKYDKYIIREPLEKAFTPMIHLCAEDDCHGSKFPNFPAELTSVLVTQPLTMNPKPHAHDYDQFLCFLGSNNKNLFEFDAEIEVVLGKEGEVNIVDTTSIVYLPKGLIHCPINFKRVGKPVLFMHLCFAPAYTRSVGDMSGHPPHSARKKYSRNEIKKLRKGVS